MKAPIEAEQLRDLRVETEHSKVSRILKIRIVRHDESVLCEQEFGMDGVDTAWQKMQELAAAKLAMQQPRLKLRPTALLSRQFRAAARPHRTI